MKELTYKRKLHLSVCVCIMFGMLMFCGISTHAETIDFSTKVAQLQVKFPQGKYWNHAGLASDNVDGYSEKACTCHKQAGYDCVYGTGPANNPCTCNHFTSRHGYGAGSTVSSELWSATQCMGFANKLGYDVFGDTTWVKVTNPTITQKSQIVVGDIVRLSNHSVFVIAKNGSIATIGEANYPNGCKINWGRTINLSTESVEYYEHASNYDTAINALTDTQMPDPNVQTDEVATDFTGWKLLADGVHSVYYEKGQMVTSKWITVDGKKYYLSADGYKVTGLADVGKYTYFFDDDGVMVKKKWLIIDGKEYYAGTNGDISKNEWLFKNINKKKVWFYAKGDGALAKNELYKIGKTTYGFDAKGMRSKGFKKIGEKYYYTTSDGVVLKKQWITVKKKKYYLSKTGARYQNKLAKIAGSRYYFDSKGCMVKNKKVTVDDTIYKADSFGRCKKIGTVEL